MGHWRDGYVAPMLLGDFYAALLVDATCIRPFVSPRLAISFALASWRRLNRAPLPTVVSVVAGDLDFMLIVICWGHERVRWTGL